MKRIIFFSALSIGLFLSSQCWANRAYVTDSFEVPLRTGPSASNKILSLPVSGQALEVMDTEGDWSHVRLLKPGGDDVEGWVPSRYLVTRIPWEVQARTLRGENDELKERLSRIESEAGQTRQLGEDLVGKLREKTAALEKLQSEYDALKQGAAEYLRLKTSFESTRSSLDNMEQEVQRLSLENEKLTSSQRNRWFATGGLVLLCGMMIGLVVGRQQKKRRASLYT